MDDGADIYRTIGLWIRRRRKWHGLTQRELAMLVDLSPSAVSAIEAGRQSIAVHLLFRFEELLGQARKPKKA